jgi:hypothetical protein
LTGELNGIYLTEPYFIDWFVQAATLQRVTRYSCCVVRFRTLGGTDWFRRLLFFACSRLWPVLVQENSNPPFRHKIPDLKKWSDWFQSQTFWEKKKNKSSTHIPHDCISRQDEGIHTGCSRSPKYQGHGSSETISN